jgi:hypothetical protein
MNRPSFAAAALTATALLVIASTDARADSGAASTEVVSSTEPAAVSGGIAAEQGTPGGGGVQDVSQAEGPDLAAEAVSPQEPVVSPALSGSEPTPATGSPAGSQPVSGSQPVPTVPVPPKEPVSATPDPPKELAVPPARSIDESPSAPSEPRAEEAPAPRQEERPAPSSDNGATSGAAPPVQGGAQDDAAGQAVTSLSTPPAPPEVDPVRRVPEKHRTGARDKDLDRLLLGVKRGLRRVQGQIEALRRDLAAGASTPTRRVAQLNAGLRWITPSLLSLEARLDAPERLGPRLQALLGNVRSRLHRARAAAGDLITVMRRSGAEGDEFRILLRGLERFRAVSGAPASTPRPPAAESPGPHAGPRLPVPDGAAAAYTHVRPEPAASPPGQGHAASPERSDNQRRATGPREPEAPAHAASSSPAPGSATASPGGGSFAAGMASLAALLAALALPRLRTRLQLQVTRWHTMAVVAPLERPG